MHDQENRRKLFKAVFNPGTLSEEYWRRALSHNVVRMVTNAVAGYFGPIASGAWSGYQTYLNGGHAGDILEAAAISYTSSVAFSYIGEANYSAPVNAVAYGAVGGTSSYLQGGDFAKGFYMSAGSQAAMSIYKNTLTDVQGCLDCNGQGPNLSPGGEAAPKLNGEAVTRTTNNNFAVSIRGPLGFWGKIGMSIAGEGGALSSTANLIPGMNAVAVLHDIWTHIDVNPLLGVPWFVASMPLAAATTYAAAASYSPATVVSLAVDKSK